MPLTLSYYFIYWGFAHISRPRRLQLYDGVQLEQREVTRYRLRDILRPLITCYIDRSWAIQSGPTSRSTAPAIQLREIVKSTHSLPGDSETSRAEEDTFKVPRAKMAGQVAGFMFTGNDSAV
jgi:hypothetical protein